MKKKEAILFVIAVILTAIIYFVSYIERKQTEKRVEEFIEQNESKEDKKLKLVPLKTIRYVK